MKIEVRIPPGPAVARHDLMANAEMTAASEKLAELLMLPPQGAGMIAALELTWHPVARALLLQELAKMCDDGLRAILEEAAQ